MEKILFYRQNRKSKIYNEIFRKFGNDSTKRFSTANAFNWDSKSIDKTCVDYDGTISNFSAVPYTLSSKVPKQWSCFLSLTIYMELITIDNFYSKLTFFYKGLGRIWCWNRLCEPFRPVGACSMGCWTSSDTAPNRWRRKHWTPTLDRGRTWSTHGLWTPIRLALAIKHE